MTGRYKAYPEYKESGVEWVGDIPASWNVKPTFLVFDPSVKKNSDGQESTVLSLSYGNIVERDVDTNLGLLPESFNTYQIVSDGDLILRLTDLQNDKKSLRVGLVKQTGIITSAYLKLRSNKSIDSRFAYRLLHFYDTTKVFYGMGGGLRQSMKFEDFRRLSILIPPFEEQQKIANFLDHETAKIDTLIAKQEKLIDLLKEKRQAVISHAVTKGLNPNAPMKDSGVEWLGEVPEHWSVVRLRFLCEITTGSRDTQDAKDDGQYPFFVRSDKIQSIDTYSFDGEGVMTSGDGAGVGKIFHHFIGKCEIHQRVYLFHKFRLITARYFYHYLKQNLEPIALAQSAKSTVDSLRLPILQEFTMCFGNESEQKEICEYVDTLSEKYDVLIQSAKNTIELMKERKTALISAAVTGKIDVRDWQEPTEQQG